MTTDQPTKKCGFTASVANGEHVSPCHKPAGHDGPHEGRCLGSRCTWESEHQHWDEEQAYIAAQEHADNMREANE